jgi:histidinol-phosphate aminotransferase
MKKHNHPRDDCRSGVSRRTFIGTAVSSAALALLNPGLARTAGRVQNTVLTDYIGRLCYNENPLGPSPAAMTAIRDSVDMGHRYPDWYAESLRMDLATLYGVSPVQIIVGCGGTEILRLAALALASPGSNVVCPYPSYSQFPADAGFLGASARYSSLDNDYRVDLDDMTANIDDNTSAVCITNPNNPTGTVLSASDISDFVDSLSSEVTVVIDEAYHDYVHDPAYQSAVDLVLQGKNVVVIRTFSKAYGLAGVRIGYAVGDSSLISRMSSWHLFATVTRLSQAAARSALTDTQHIADTVTLNDQVKQCCFDNFDVMGLDYIPSETNFFMVDVGRSASGVSSQLSARDIQVRTGWGMPNHLRVSTGTMEEMENFITALEEILGIGGSDEPCYLTGPVLYANYPNPASGRTCIPYALTTEGHVRLQIFNIRGQLVKTLVNRQQPPGYQGDLHWDGTDQSGNRVASGSYFYRMNVGNFTETRRIIWIR